MCGIAGLARFDQGRVDVSALRRMCQALLHRGPDDEGMMTWPPPETTGAGASAGLGCRRLSIIDVEGGHQPIVNERGDIWVVFNGEIYNFAELRSRLERCRHRFATRSDTEVVVHAYEEYGDDFVTHLDGMFALAIWDGWKERLILARDHFGKKPLFYRETAEGLAFASELQPLLLSPGPASPEIDREALYDYLAYMAVPAPRTIYRGVFKLPPAHVLVADRNGTTVRQYWSLDYQPKVKISEQDAIAHVRELMVEAVRKRLVSEVPLGAFLSGGVDSGGVVALMASLSTQPVKTFSIGFQDPRYSELAGARAIATTFGCEHHEFVVKPHAIDVLPDLVRHFGEPYADSSAIPMSYLAARTRAHVTVALTGDGGDEVFAGYGRHRRNRLVELWAESSPLARKMGRAARGRLSASGRSRLRRVLESAGLSRSERYRAWAGVFSPEEIAALTGLPGEGQADVTRLFSESVHLDAVDAMLAVDTRFYLPTDLLPKMDITTMAHSLEARSPLLDRDLAEFVARLPSALKLRRLTTKYVLKRVLDGLVPAETLARRKRGFAVPIGAWFRGELRPFLKDHLQRSHAAAAGLVRQSGVDALVEQHLSGRADRAHHLWTVLMLELWYRECVEA